MPCNPVRHGTNSTSPSADHPLSDRIHPSREIHARDYPILLPVRDPMPDVSDFEYFSNKKPDKLYGSKVFDMGSGRIRVLSKTRDQTEEHRFVSLKNEIVLYVSPGGRYELVARV